VVLLLFGVILVVVVVVGYVIIDLSIDVVELVGDSGKKNGSGGRSGESDLQSSVV
jgi:hypothetical protein